ncbi:MAG: FAD-dependent oxidoreductase, partial [Actinomycetota bacterium]
MRVVIIGAGIVGVTAALTLAEAGAEVIVLERGSVAGEASGLNAGVVGGGGWGHRPDIDVALKMGSRQRYLDLADQRGHDIGLDRTGTLTVIRNEAELTWADATVAADRDAGRLVELLDDTELREHEPELDPALLGAILDPLAVRAEPVAATEAFATEARRAGAVLRTGCAVTGLDPSPGGGWDLGIGGSTTTIGADVVVVAAGPWCAELGRLVGLDIPIAAVRGQMWASPALPPVLRHALAAAESPTDWADPAEATTPPFLTHV